MDNNIYDNWSSIVLALATTGGIILEASSRKRKIIISTMSSHSPDQSGELEFQEFIVSISELKKILSEASDLQAEVNQMVQEVDENGYDGAKAKNKNTSTIKKDKKKSAK